MSNPIQVIDLGTTIETDNLADYKEFMSEVEKTGIRGLRCGQFNYVSGEDYQAMPVRITLHDGTNYEFTVGLDLDPLEDSDEEMIEMIINHVKECIEQVEEEDSEEDVD